jgi:phage pi2 protein 07
MWWKSYNYNVKIYVPVGQMELTKKELEEIKSKSPTAQSKYLEEKNLKFNYLGYKRTHGKYTSVKGTPMFVTFNPNRKLPSIPLTLLYDDGIHLIQISRDILVPIKKPNTVLEVGKSVSIAIEDDNQWRLWNNQMADRVNNKFQDIDAQKKVVFYFVVGIVAMVLLGGLILWLVYKSSVKGYGAGEKIATAINQYTGNSVPK